MCFSDHVVAMIGYNYLTNIIIVNFDYIVLILPRIVSNVLQSLFRERVEVEHNIHH